MSAAGPANPGAGAASRGRSSIVSPMSAETYADRSIRRLVWWTTGGLLTGLAAIFLWAPTDEFQGIPQKIFYLHVPAADRKSVV